MVKNIIVQLDLSEPDAVDMYDRIRLGFKKHDPPRLRKLPEVPKRLMEVSRNTDSLYLCIVCLLFSSSLSSLTKNSQEILTLFKKLNKNKF